MAIITVVVVVPMHMKVKKAILFREPKRSNCPYGSRFFLKTESSSAGQEIPSVFNEVRHFLKS